MSNSPEIPLDKEVRNTKSMSPTQTKRPVTAANPLNANGEITHCPHCRNKLLTQRSPICSWCGKPINDEKYLEKAAAERAAVDAAMREKLARDEAKPKKTGLIAKITNAANNVLQNDDIT
jgi:hypothetical protein